MTTFITAILFMTLFKNIEGVKIDGGPLWALVLSFCSFLFTILYWIYQILRLVLLTTCTLGIYLYFAYKRIVEVGLANHILALRTAPMRFLAKTFPEQLEFDTDKSADTLAKYILGLTILFTLAPG